jgi:hypothetical protein
MPIPIVGFCSSEEGEEAKTNKELSNGWGVTLNKPAPQSAANN